MADEKQEIKLSKDQLEELENGRDKEGEKKHDAQ